jgi:hypothetical protein
MIIMHRICDRCKKEEIIDDLTKNYLSCEPKYVPSKIPKYMISTSDENNLYKEINLCEECEREFTAFLTEFDIPN